MTIQPIWKPIEVDMTGALEDGAVDFSVRTGGSIIYEGRAYADIYNVCVVRLNDILKDYLGVRYLPLTGNTYLDTRAVVAFSIVYGDTTTTIKVLNDWSYNPAAWSDSTPAILTDEIAHWDCHTIRPFTIIGASEYSWELRDEFGSTLSGEDRTITGESETVYADPYMPGYFVIRAGDDEYIYPIVEKCDKGTLIYRNLIGGFDVLPLASVTETESYTRESYETAGNNTGRDRHIIRDYCEAVTRAYTLRTPILTDAQAAKMNGAIGSVQAWLHTAERGYEAVTIKTGSCKRKTFRNEGRKRIVYEFEVEFAQPMERR